jgi:hypothetical protein
MLTTQPSNAKSFKINGIALISFVFSSTSRTLRHRDRSLHHASTKCTDDLPPSARAVCCSNLVALPRNFLPSILTSVPSANLMFRLTHMTNICSKATGSIRDITRFSVSCDGIPLVKGRYRRNQSNLSSPKSTISSHSEHPLITALIVKNKISSSGYSIFALWRGSGTSFR